MPQPKSRGLRLPPWYLLELGLGATQECKSLGALALNQGFECFPDQGGFSETPVSKAAWASKSSSMAMVVRMAIPFKGRHIFLHNLMPQSVRANMSGVRRFRHGAG